MCASASERVRASVSAFQESRDQSGKPDGGEKWQDKIFAAHTCKRRGGKNYNDPTYGTASRVESGGRLDFAHDHRYP